MEMLLWELFVYLEFLIGGFPGAAADMGAEVGSGQRRRQREAAGQITSDSLLLLFWISFLFRGRNKYLLFLSLITSKCLITSETLFIFGGNVNYVFITGGLLITPKG